MNMNIDKFEVIYTVPYNLSYLVSVPNFRNKH